MAMPCDGQVRVSHIRKQKPDALMTRQSVGSRVINPDLKTSENRVMVKMAKNPRALGIRTSSEQVSHTLRPASHAQSPSEQWKK